MKWQKRFCDGILLKMLVKNHYLPNIFIEMVPQNRF